MSVVIRFLPESCREVILKEFSYNQSDDSNNISFLHFLASTPYLNDINSINRTLIAELRNDDEAFSLGRLDIDICEESGEQTIAILFCVRFGLITQTTVLDQLVDHVLTKARQVEESSKVKLDSLIVVVKYLTI